MKHGSIDERRWFRRCVGVAFRRGRVEQLRIDGLVPAEILDAYRHLPIWHVDASPVGRPRRETGVVVEHEEEVRRAFGGLLRRVRCPVRRRVAHVELDHAVEAFLRPGRCAVRG